jgi:hypothetical protein
MVLINVVGNDLLRYPIWFLKLGSALIGGLIMVYLIYHVKKAATIYALIMFYLSLLFSQYLLAIFGISGANWTIMVNLCTVAMNIWLFATFIWSIRKHINDYAMKDIRSIALRWTLVFMPFSIVTWGDAVYIDDKFKSSYDNCDDCTIIDAMLIIWWITLVISIIVNLTKACIAVMLRYVLCSEEHKQERRLLAYLLTSSLSLALNNFAILFEVPFLDMFTHLLTHIMFIPLCNSFVVQRDKLDINYV